MRFFVPLRRDPASLPPVLALVHGLSQLEHEVDLLVYDVSDEVRGRFDGSLVRFHQVSETPYPITGTLGQRAVATARSYVALLRLMAANRTRYDYVWMANWDFARFAGCARLVGFRAPVIYQVHEFSPRNFSFCRQADFTVMPEENRAWMTYFLAGLNRRPIVLPNIPMADPMECVGLGKDETLEGLHASGKRVVLYQGTMHDTRRCLRELVGSLRHLEDNVVLAVMPSVSNHPGWDSTLREFVRESGVDEGRVIVLRTRTPPAHLPVLSQADVGIGLYRPTSLNQVYCAPSRIYEFAGAGVPTVLPDFPGIRAHAAIHGGIATCDPEDSVSIAAAIRTLLDPATRSAKAREARSFFEASGSYVDNLRRALEVVIGPSA